MTIKLISSPALTRPRAKSRQAIAATDRGKNGTGRINWITNPPRPIFLLSLAGDRGS
jgi:hypothetical protein